MSINTAQEPSSFSQFYRNNVSQLVNIIEQNDMKALKKMMKKPRIVKNLDLVQRGILTAFDENNCEALKILSSSSPLPDLFEPEFIHCVVSSPKVDFLRTLLNDKRVDVNQLIASLTPLMTACCGFKSPARIYDHEKDVEEKDEIPRTEACRDEIVRELLRHPKIDVNAQDKTECFALLYALRKGTSGIVNMLINHKDITDNDIQESLLIGMRQLSQDFYPIDLDLLDIFMKKNFENEFILKNLTSERFEFHEHLQSWIAEELEIKIREEYYNDNLNVSEESVCNKAFGFSLEILQAYILKCKCAYCSGTKHIKQQTYLDDDFSFSDHDSGYKCFKNCGLSSKDPKAKCVLETKVPVLFENRSMAYDLIDFIYRPLPALYQDILINGGHENDLDDIINGTITVQELCQESESKDRAENIFSDDQSNEELCHESESKDKAENVFSDDQSNEELCQESESKDKSENVFSDDKSNENVDKCSLCWSCSSTSVKLYKCSGCRKARYCDDKCIANDWKEHANFCVKMQRKRNLKKSLKIHVTMG